MLSRRDFVQVALAAGTLTATSGILGRAAAQQKITQADLLRFDGGGPLTILHMTDCHGQLMPVYFREPSVNLGVGEVEGKPPHISGKEFLSTFGIAPGSHLQYTLTDQDFEALARNYGKIGGMDRMATLIKAIRSERGADNTLVLDGGDTLHGSYTVMKTAGDDMATIIDALGIEATTGHWEFTLGENRVTELFGNRETAGKVKAAFLANNIRDNEFEEPVFHASKMFVKAGIKVAVIGQAFPFTPIANPRWMMPKWSFGIREDDVRKAVAKARADGARVVVLLSHNGFDVDRKLASRVEGIDVILTGHTHDALPVPVTVGKTLLIASGSHTKFLSRLDLAPKGDGTIDYKYQLIPVLADAIAPDPEIAKLIASIRAPHEAVLKEELARAEQLLYRRGNFNGTLDDVICDALISERDAEISLSPGFRWGNTIVSGQMITAEDVYNATAISYPAAYRSKMSGEMLKTILEDVADNLFNIDPYYQQGGDMVRVGGMKYRISVDKPMGQRISNMTLAKTGTAIEASKEYVVSGWASVNQATEGPPIWDVVSAYLRKKKSVAPSGNSGIEIVRG
ncbi:MAG TPA: thiosulfohydrolase SoxB [Hyphomicrobiaceae bacterium]|nr:thiosulfohydrolase SoxB [Hyphomicrobiaceae bacterium]